MATTKNAYQVTAIAGEWVAGIKVPDDGILYLTAKEAAYDILLGTIVLLYSEPPPAAVPRILGTDTVHTERNGSKREVTVDEIRDLNSDQIEEAGGATVTRSIINSIIFG